MCGIGGVSLVPNADIDVPHILTRMLVHQKHRGPDGNGMWWEPTVRVGLCHSRLAILDLSKAGRQPMFSADGNFITVYNGEIYNWKELRQTLESQGVAFFTKTDTEVLLEAYRVFGVDVVHHLRGMFAFVILDRRSGMLFAARDRIGKKPFVYAETSHGFVFSSEIPAVLSMPGCGRHLSHDALAGMLLHNVRHVVDPHTAYQGIHRLQAGHAMVVREGKIEKIWQYWQPRAENIEATPFLLREKLENAIRLRTEADVPIGALLSGGVDSSAIVAIMARRSVEPIRTYAMGMNRADEDLRRARVMAARLGCKHREFYFDPKQQWDGFCRLIHGYGEPVMVLPLIYALQLCEAIHQDGLKVVLGGHGADELFYGYTGHVRTARISAVISAFRPVACLSGMGMGRMFPLLSMFFAKPGTRKSEFYRYCAERDWARVLCSDARASLCNVVADALAYWGKDCPTNAFIDESNFCALMVENTHSLTTSSDLPPMLASVEMRAPFLDQDIIDFAFSTPAQKKVPWFAPLHRLKWILREAVRDLIPPDILFAPKRGFGFGIPQDDVLRGPWAKYGDELFSDPHDAEGLFDQNALRIVWKEFKEGGSRGSNVVPNLFAIQYWLQSTGYPR